MKNYLTLLLILFCLTNVLSQGKEEKFITTEEQNAAWIVDFNNKNLEDQLDALKERWSTDQKVYYTFRNPHGNTPLKKGFEAITFSRPVYIFKSGDSRPLILPYNPSPELIQEVNSVLAPENVSSIEFSNDIMSRALYGAGARHGAIIINISEKDQFSKLKSAI